MSDTEHSTVTEQHYQDIIQQNKAVADLAARSGAAKERAKAAKQRYEEGIAELTELIRRGPDPQAKLPGMEDVDAKSDAWRTVTLEEAGLPSKLLKPFKEFSWEGGSIKTLGDLADWQAEYELANIHGIGPKLADEIADTLVKFWEEHPEYTRPADDDDEEEEEEEEDDEE